MTIDKDRVSKLIKIIESLEAQLDRASDDIKDLKAENEGLRKAIRKQVYDDAGADMDAEERTRAKNRSWRP